jgi:hypothetical protein
MAQNSPLNVADNLTVRSLSDRNDFRNVYDLSGGYNKFGMIVNILNMPFGGGKQFETDKYEKSVMGRGHVIAQVASGSQVGNTLVLTLQPQGTPPAPVDTFRVGDVVVAADHSVSGKVIATTPGSITLEATESTIPAMNTAFSTAGTYVKVLGDSSPNFYSDGKSPLYEFPELIYNYSAVKRDTYLASRRENIKSRIYYKDKFWGDAQLDLMVQRFLRQMEKQMLFSNQAQWTSQVGGLSDLNGGVRWSIINRGGEYLPLASALTQAQFDNFLANVWSRKASRTTPITLFMGRGMMQHIQRNFTDGYILNAGSMNTFGGSEVKGVDVRKYTIAGVEVAMVELPVLNDTEFFPELTSVSGLSNPYRQQHTCFALDLDPIEVKGGGLAPAIEKIFRGPSEFYCGYIKGMADAGVPTVDNFADYSVDIVSSVDAHRCDIMADNGIDMIGKFSGLIELVA